MGEHGWQIMAIFEVVLIVLLLALVAGKLVITTNQPKTFAAPSRTLLIAAEKRGEQFLTFHFSGTGVTAGYASHAIAGDMEWHNVFFAISGTGEITLAIQVSGGATADVAGNVSLDKFSMLFCTAQTQLGNPTTVYIGIVWTPPDCGNAA